MQGWRADCSNADLSTVTVLSFCAIYYCTWYVCTYIIKVGGVTGNVFVDDTPNSSSSQCNNNANELMTGMCMHTLHCIYRGNN